MNNRCYGQTRAEQDFIGDRAEIIGDRNWPAVVITCPLHVVDFKILGSGLVRVVIDWIEMNARSVNAIGAATPDPVCKCPNGSIVDTDITDYIGDLAISSNRRCSAGDGTGVIGAAVR